MADLNKVIAALRCCVDGERDCDGCPYERGMDESCITEVMADALELLEGIPRTCGSCMYVGVGGVSHHGYSCPDKRCKRCGAHMDEEVADG